MTDFKEFAEAGGLLSFGPDLVDSYRRAATHVDKILKGANPADLPMEQPTKFDLVVNLKTATSSRPDHSAVGPGTGHQGDRVGPIARRMRLASPERSERDEPRRRTSSDGADGDGARRSSLRSGWPQSFPALRGIVWVIWGRFWRSRPGQNLGSMQVRTLGRGQTLDRGARRRGADGSARPGSCAAPHVPQVIVLTGRLGIGPGRTGRRRSPARSSSDGIPERDAHPTAGAVVPRAACAYHGPISALPRQRFPPRPERVSPLIPTFSPTRFHERAPFPFEQCFSASKESRGDEHL